MSRVFTVLPWCNLKSLARRLATLVCLACATLRLHGQTIQFDNGDGSLDWGNAWNWVGDLLPASNSAVDLAGFNTRLRWATFNVAGLTNTKVNGTLNIDNGGSITIGAENINIGSAGFNLNLINGNCKFPSLFTDPTIADSAGRIEVKGGTLTVTDRIFLGNQSNASTRANGFTMSAGTLDLSGALNGLTLYGADADDRPSFEIIGSAGSFASASGRSPIVLANANATDPAATAASVRFVLNNAAVSTVYASNLVLANNPITIDLSQLSVMTGAFTFPLFEYSGSLVGAFAEPTFVGLGSNTATLTHDAIGKRFNLNVWLNNSFSVANFNLPPQDANGWTILTPSSDTRLVYVDPISGSDSNTTYYAPGAANVGSDPQFPTGVVAACKTIAQAKSLTRDNKPDWILLRSGRVFSGPLDFRNGQSPTERAVVCSYGTGARPELRTEPLFDNLGNEITSTGIAPWSASNVIVCGIKFWSYTRDDAAPDSFKMSDGSPGFHFNSQWGPVRDILIEDCFFRCYRTNELIGSARYGTPITRFVMRRNIISKNYGTRSAGVGLWFNAESQPVQASVLLEQNTFDHNGWRVQNFTGSQWNNTDGQATFRSHNTYFGSSTGVIFKGNHFLRASSIGNKWIAGTGNRSTTSVIIEDNFYAEGELGISMGGNETGSYRFNDIQIKNNVMTDLGRTDPTNRGGLYWGLDAFDWNYGDIINNLFIHQRAAFTNTRAMYIGSMGGSGKANDIHVKGNIMANLRGSPSSGLVIFSQPMSNLAFEGNITQSPTATLTIGYPAGGCAFSGTNRYWSSAPSNQLFRLNGSYSDLSEWKNATGDNGAVTAAPSFTDPTRDVESYMQSLGLGNTFQDFINALYGQSKANWNPNLTANRVNNWLRAGFDMASVPGDGDTTAAVYEGFNYTPGADLATQSQPAPFKAWNAGRAPGYTLEANSLSYTNGGKLPTSGNSLCGGHIWKTTGMYFDLSNAAWSPFKPANLPNQWGGTTTAIGMDDTTLYVSFLLGNTSDRAAVGLTTDRYSNAEPWSQMGVGAAVSVTPSGSVALRVGSYTGGTFDLIRHNGIHGIPAAHAVQDATAPSVTPRSTNLYVLKFEFGASRDKVSLFVNPMVGAAEPSVASATVIPDGNVVLNSVSIYLGHSAGFSKFDELRFSPTWAGAFR